MYDRFNVYLQKDDFVIYNECSVGKVVDTNIIMPPKLSSSASVVDWFSYPSPPPKLIRAMLIKTEHGKEYWVTNFKKVIKIGGLPNSVTNKFK